MAIASLEEGGLKDPKAAKTLRKAMNGEFDKKNRKMIYSQVISDIEKGYLSSFYFKENKAKLIEIITKENNNIKNKEKEF